MPLTASRRARRPPLGSDVERAVGSIESATEHALSALLRRSMRRQRAALERTAPPEEVVVYACAACTKAFDSDVALRQHWRRRHDAASPALAAAAAAAEPAPPPPPPPPLAGAPAEHALATLRRELAALRREFADSVAGRSSGSAAAAGAQGPSASDGLHDHEPTEGPPSTTATAHALRRELASLRAVGARRDELLLDVTAASRHALQRLQAQVDELRAAVEATPRGATSTTAPPPHPLWAPPPPPPQCAAASSMGPPPAAGSSWRWWPEPHQPSAEAALPPPPSPRTAMEGDAAVNRTRTGATTAAAPTMPPAPSGGAWQLRAQRAGGEWPKGGPAEVHVPPLPRRRGSDDEDGEWKGRARTLQRQLAAARAGHADAARRAAALGAATAAMRAHAALPPPPAASRAAPPTVDTLMLLVPRLPCATRRKPPAAVAVEAAFRLSYQWQRLPAAPSAWAGSANCASLLDAGERAGEPGVSAGWAPLLPVETHVSDTSPVRVRVPPSWELVLAVPMLLLPPPPQGGGAADSAWARGCGHNSGLMMPAHLHVTVHRTMTLREVRNAIADQLGLSDAESVRVALCGVGGGSSPACVALGDGATVEEAALFQQRPVLAWVPMVAAPPAPPIEAVPSAAGAEAAAARAHRGAGCAATSTPPELPTGAARFIAAATTTPTTINTTASAADSCSGVYGAAATGARAIASPPGAAAASLPAATPAAAAVAANGSPAVAALAHAAVVRPHKVAALQRSISRNIRDVLDVLVRSGSSVAGGASGSSSVRSASVRGGAASSSLHSRRGSSAHAFAATMIALVPSATSSVTATAGADCTSGGGGGGGGGDGGGAAASQPETASTTESERGGAEATLGSSTDAVQRVAVPPAAADGLRNKCMERNAPLDRQQAAADGHPDPRPQQPEGEHEPASVASSAPAAHHHFDRTITEISALSELDAGSDGCSGDVDCDDTGGVIVQRGGTQLLEPVRGTIACGSGVASTAALADDAPGRDASRSAVSLLPPAQPFVPASVSAPLTWATQDGSCTSSGAVYTLVPSRSTPRQPSFTDMTLEFDLGDGGVHACSSEKEGGGPQPPPSPPAAMSEARVLRFDEGCEVMLVHATPTASRSRSSAEPACATGADSARLLWGAHALRAQAPMDDVYADTGAGSDESDDDESPEGLTFDPTAVPAPGAEPADSEGADLGELACARPKTARAAAHAHAPQVPHAHMQMARDRDDHD